MEEIERLKRKWDEVLLLTATGAASYMQHREPEVLKTFLLLLLGLLKVTTNLRTKIKENQFEESIPMFQETEESLYLFGRLPLESGEEFIERYTLEVETQLEALDGPTTET
jgi:hypothetical protein